MAELKTSQDQIIFFVIQPKKKRKENLIYLAWGDEDPKPSIK